MNWLCIFLGFCAADHPPRGGPLRRRQGDRDAGRALLPLLRADALVGQTWRDRVRVGAIPLGGYVKITGMNPEEELPPEVEHRAYYRQPVWKRIVVIAAGPAVNIVLAFAILFVVYLAQRPADVDPDGRRSPRRHARAAKVLQPGDRIVAVDGRRYPGLERRRAARTVRRATSASHECAGKQVEGCVAATPVALRSSATASRRRSRSRPSTTRADKRPLIGFAYGTEPGRPRRRRRRRPSRRHDLGGRLEHRPTSSPTLRTGTAQAGLRRRRRQRRRQPDDRRRRSSARCCCSPWSASRSA